MSVLTTNYLSLPALRVADKHEGRRSTTSILESGLQAGVFAASGAITVATAVLLLVG